MKGKKIDTDMLRRLWPTKLTDKAMAEKLNCTRGAMRRVADQIGLKPRRFVWARDVEHEMRT